MACQQHLPGDVLGTLELQPSQAGKSQPCSPLCSPALLCWCSLLLWSWVCSHNPEGLEANPEFWSASTCCCNAKRGRGRSTPRRWRLYRTTWLPKACGGKHVEVNWFPGKSLRCLSFRTWGGVPLGTVTLCFMVYMTQEWRSVLLWAGYLGLLAFLQLHLESIGNVFPQCLILISLNGWLFWAVEPLPLFLRALLLLLTERKTFSLLTQGPAPPQTSNRWNMAAAQVFI